jgi:3',5'-nucleoside bisphosphate phosphatase
MHSTASDGAYSPSEVVQIALTKQMDVIALTDHDSVNGLDEALRAASGSALQILSGVELSSEDDLKDRHILGYLFDPTHLEFLAALSTLRESRVNRAELIVKKLDELGVHVPLERVYAIAGTGSVGRPHVARAMLEAGYVTSQQDAFDKYLNDDGPAYVPHHRLSPAGAIDLIHSAGGVAVLAHPGRLTGDYVTIIEGLAPLGLDGVEVYYPDHTSDLIASLRSLAKKHHLLMTVGGDFHRREGDGSARLGSVKTPADFDCVPALRERAAQYQAKQ